MPNEKHYILTFAWPIAKNLEVVTRDHKTNKLSHVPFSQNLWLTELLSLDQHYDKDDGL